MIWSEMMIPPPPPAPEAPKNEIHVTAPVIPPSVQFSDLRPVKYRCADSTGELWEHADKAFLEAWVADRNAKRASLIQNIYAARTYECRNGNCR